MESQNHLNTDYVTLLAEAEALLSGHAHRIANAANLSALLYARLPALNWVGFYFYEDGRLIVGPFQGQPACVAIALTQGVCGAAARTGQTQRVADVHEFAGHIACDPKSRSELVIPLFRNGELLGVLDIDSPEHDRFSAEDQAGLEAIATCYIKSLG
jgi:GAF domain-containing protein